MDSVIHGSASMVANVNTTIIHNVYSSVLLSVLRREPKSQPLMSPLPNQLEPRNRLTSLRPSQLRPRSQLLMSPLLNLRMRRHRVLHTRLLTNLNRMDKPIQPTIRNPDGTRRRV